MKALIINNGTSYLEELKKLLVGSVVNIIESPQISNVKYGDADLVILSGGHGLPVMDEGNPYTEEIQFIRSSFVPILGICLGCELIARAFGANLRLMERREKGVLDISPIQSDRLFKNIQGFSVYESHRWVVEELSRDLVGLAKSKDGYEVIKHRQKLIYGFQFHPEAFVEQTSGDDIFRNFLGGIGF